MGEGFNWRDIVLKMSRWSPLAWAIILIGIALGLVAIDNSFIRKLAIAPAVIGLLLFYQAIFKNKM